jgi:hypothetical protein
MHLGNGRAGAIASSSFRFAAYQKALVSLRLLSRAQVLPFQISYQDHKGRDNRKYELRANDAEEAKRWMAALKRSLA